MWFTLTLRVLEASPTEADKGSHPSPITMLKKTALLEKDGFPYMVKKGKQIRAGVSPPPPFQKKTYFFAGGVP